MSRPVPRFREFVGHKQVVDRLRRQLDGAKARGEPFPSTLFIGPSGVGKTLLAKSLAEEMGTSLTVLNGYAEAAELSNAFQQANACDFVFIDEMHNLTPKAQELLFHVIDERRVPLCGPNGKGAGTTFADVHPLTVMLATDQPGRLLNALDKRMELKETLDYYSDREMRGIVDRLAADSNLLISAQAANQLARISWGVPRRARHHVGNLRRHFPDAEHQQISVDHMREFLSDFGIDSQGLGRNEQNYLRFLASKGKAALETLALHLGFDMDYVRRQVEPILTRAGLLLIGPGGRKLTNEGRQLYGKSEQAPDELI